MSSSPGEPASHTALIIGGGPAGLTAAYELVTRAGVRPVVCEKLDLLGGIARTVNYKGNRIDIGGHRFFSKSDRVMDWWHAMMPFQQSAENVTHIDYQGATRTIHMTDAADPEKRDDVMLLRSRSSRIYFLRKFFDYPISLSRNTVVNLGFARMMRIGAGYIQARLFPIRPEVTLEDFFINRFGRELYETFFESYTEKVWGLPCARISAEWGAQRVKGLSITKAISHAVRSQFSRKKDIAQKQVETSLIEQFLYPKYGPGQMWELCGEKITRHGGEVRMGRVIKKLYIEDNRIRAAEIACNGTTERVEADYFFSTMPVSDLIAALAAGGADVPEPVRETAANLPYRDFITVGLLVTGLKVKPEAHEAAKLIRDNWIYIQEPDVLVGRLQIFNNWSPYLVADPGTVWIGLEYFCNEGDGLWSRTDEQLAALGREELSRIGIIDHGAVLDSTVIRVEKTYPAYFGAYEQFHLVREYLDPIENLFLIGRNGMHRYNNQDHSMLTAMTAVDNIIAGIRDKSNIWAVNTEQDYHEESREPSTKE
ncbi:MAG TPA: NAD(P)/FAD-dependent oxidoreductase [Chthoniobacteraceae bacterium]|jgi:protoporphyrinogen oxidase|nr:NAD(P)/FAD-dependent oxidoreductase [Chthoniobacteraceae bacterium]